VGSASLRMSCKVSFRVVECTKRYGTRVRASDVRVCNPADQVQISVKDEGPLLVPKSEANSEVVAEEEATTEDTNDTICAFHLCNAINAALGNAAEDCTFAFPCSLRILLGPLRITHCSLHNHPLLLRILSEPLRSRSCLPASTF